MCQVYEDLAAKTGANWNVTFPQDELDPGKKDQIFASLLDGVRRETEVLIQKFCYVLLEKMKSNSTC